MKISIVTVVFNNKEQLEDALKSVLGQTHEDIEYIVVDGGSSDGTVDVIKKYEEKITKWISEPDKGIYDAMNKGLELSTGDVAGFLNSDDVYYDEQVLAKIAAALADPQWDACCGDIVYAGARGSQNVNRHWATGPYKQGAFRKGWVPPHPAFFVRKKILDNHPAFNLDFSISADFELMLRLIEKHKIKMNYIPEIIVKMRWGGSSTQNLKNIAKGNLQKYRAFKQNRLKVSPLYFIYNFLFKFKQLRGRG
ncbi:MAG: glycosyltransferase [bacterium]|nr:glycosyltransferase [bacterium]